MPIIGLIAGILCADQLSKYYIASTMAVNTSLPVVDNVFYITYVLNPGAAFGLFAHARGFFIGVAAAMLAAFVLAWPRLAACGKVFRFGAALLAGGAAGNLIDRVQTGYVVDFFDFRFWPVFNVADIAIVLGVGCLLYAALYPARRRDGGS